jgi:hypothetical protein
MFGSVILDTAIGMILVFLLLSLMVTAANEIIAAALLSRAKWLRKGLNRLLTAGWVDRLYAHPLIQGTAIDPPTKWQQLSSLPWRGEGPSYIPSRAFATALLDLVTEDDNSLLTAKTALQRVLDRIPASRGSIAALVDTMQGAAAALPSTTAAGKRLQADLRALLAQLGAGPVDAASLAQALRGIAQATGDPVLAQAKAQLEALAKTAEGMPPPSVSQSQRELDAVASFAVPLGSAGEDLRKELKELRDSIDTKDYTIGDARNEIQRFIDQLSDRYMTDVIAAIPDQHVRATLSVLLDDAGHDLERFKENIEVWFNNSMDRVGGWYKRQSQWVIAGLAVTVAIGLNADTLLIVHHLSTQSGARDALVAQARGFTERPLPNDGGPGGVDPYARFKLIQDQLDQLGLPIGWFRNDSAINSAGGHSQSVAAVFRQSNFLVLPKTSVVPFEVDFAGWWRAISFHLIGWLLTALAASLGAPFWFDTLNKFMSVRSAGKAPEERPKPPKDVPIPLEPGQTPREADGLRSANSK